MEALNIVETIIKSNDKFELVQIEKQYEKFKSVRHEIRNIDKAYNRGFAGYKLEDIITIFDKQYS